jgi:NTP pyrophosphatase (non-canonical NTP hydrolase)
MNYPQYRESSELVLAAGVLAHLSKWIDEHPDNAARDPEARTWGRLAKVSEECGEVIAAYIGATGQNPRKGVTHTDDNVRSELLDVAITALCAYEHMTGNRALSLDALLAHIEATRTRMDATRNGSLR